MFTFLGGVSNLGAIPAVLIYGAFLGIAHKWSESIDRKKAQESTNEKKKLNNVMSNTAAFGESQSTGRILSQSSFTSSSGIINTELGASKGVDNSQIERESMISQVPSPRYCRKCGFELIEGSNFCSRCGTPVIRKI